MNDIAQYTKSYVEDNGYKLIFVADKLGITRQGLNNLFNKKTFNVADANKILATLNKQLKVTYSIIDTDK